MAGTNDDGIEVQVRLFRLAQHAAGTCGSLTPRDAFEQSRGAWLGLKRMMQGGADSVADGAVDDVYPATPEARGCPVAPNRLYTALRRPPEARLFRRRLMADEPEGVDRRGFLKHAATGVAAAAVPGAMHAQEHDHTHQAVPSDPALRTKALESLLVEKGLVDPAALDALVDAYETQIGPRNGARVVARAWTNPAFKKRLLEDGGAAIAEFGYPAMQGEHMVVVENSDKVHNLVVCTLCSCYPWPVLGLPPVWYKSAPYRSRAVIDPRGVLREFGLNLSDDVEVRVWDSTAEIRYLVLPERPSGTESMREEELASLITRDSMVGVAKVAAPGGRA
jgi:nitrile hydratase